MNERCAILQIIADATDPVGWYNIATQLPAKGIILAGNLIAVLDALVSEGLLAHEVRSGYPHGVYLLTVVGQELLLRDSSVAR
ncbi:MAG: hypothetical protein M3Z04_08005 [Chloroflexota bacterium]|nr:hypothetical protein [Chloroflexota bacterium]